MFKSNNALSLIIVSFFLVFLDFFRILGFVRTPLDGLIIPFKKNIYELSIFFQNLGSALIQYPHYQTIISREKKLSTEKVEYEWQLKLLRQENEKLRFQLGSSYPPSYQFIPTRVIALSKNLEIDIGEKAGVKVGMAVVDGQSFIGKVINVATLRSQVRLPNDAESETSVRTQRGVTGKVVGRAEGSLFLEKVLQKDQLFLDDLVVTSGEDNLPPNLLIGKIVHITTDDTDTYKQAKIEPIINYANESIVFVIKSE